MLNPLAFISPLSSNSTQIIKWSSNKRFWCAYLQADSIEGICRHVCLLVVEFFVDLVGFEPIRAKWLPCGFFFARRFWGMVYNLTQSSNLTQFAFLAWAHVCDLCTVTLGLISYLQFCPKILFLAIEAWGRNLKCVKSLHRSGYLVFPLMRSYAMPWFFTWHAKFL